MADIGHQNQSSQGVAMLQIGLHQALPVVALVLADAGVTKARRVNQKAFRRELKIIEQLGASRCPADPGQHASATQGVNRAGLAHIGSAQKQNFRFRRRALIQFGNAFHKARLLPVNGRKRWHNQRPFDLVENKMIGLSGLKRFGALVFFWVSLGSASVSALESPYQETSLAQPSVHALANGVNYTTKPVPVPKRGPADKVEVIEIFWYGCPHCNRLQPYLHDWEQRYDRDVVYYERVPAPFNPT